MQSTKSAKVYGAILSNPGITAREINRMLGFSGSDCRATTAALQNFAKRGAVVAVPGSTERNTKYYKGRSPVVLRQAAGVSQRNIDSMAAQAQREVEKSIALLEGVLAKLKSVA